MLLDNAKDIRVGTRKVSKVYVGGTQVWPRGVGKHFRFTKKIVWLRKSGGYKAENGVESDTEWKIE